MKQRQLKVIQLLLENKEYLSAKTYANLLGISEKSFRRDLEELEPFFKKYDAEVIKKIGVGVLLEVDPQQRILLNAEIEKLVWIDRQGKRIPFIKRNESKERYAAKFTVKRRRDLQCFANCRKLLLK